MTETPVKMLQTCPVCGVDAAKSERIADDFIELFGARLTYSVDLCPDCGIIYSRDRSRHDDLYTPAVDMEKEHGHQKPALAALSDGVWNLQTKTLQVAEIIAAMPSLEPVRYLEIGASDGMLFRMVHQRTGAQNRTLSATLVESTGAAGPCAAIEGCTVVSHSFLDDFDAPHAAYDIAVLSHCLEHFDNPREVIAKVHKMLAPGAVVYVEVPDGMRYDRCISTPLGYFHVLNFNLLNLTWMLADLGFDCGDRVERSHYPGLRVIATKSSRGHRAPISEQSLRLSQAALGAWQDARKAAFDRLVGIEGPGTLVYGAGVHTIALFERFPEWAGTCDVADSNARVVDFLGVRVLSPGDLDFSAYERVVVSSYAYQDAIAKQLQDAGCPADKIITLYDEIFTYVA